MGLIKNTEWMIDIVGLKYVKYFARESGEFILQACMHGAYDVIEWAVLTTEKFNLLEREMCKTYNTWNGEKTTLLLFLCHMNIADMRSIALLRAKGFPVKLLRHKFEKRNALEKALFYKNIEMTRELLDDQTWARALMWSEGEFERLSQMVEVDSELHKFLRKRWHEIHRNFF